MSAYEYVALTHPIIALLLVLRWKRLDASARFAVPIYIASMPVTVVVYLLLLRELPFVLMGFPGLAMAAGQLIWAIRNEREES